MASSSRTSDSRRRKRPAPTPTIQETADREKKKTRSFSVDQEIVLLEEIQDFCKKYGEESSWKRFYETSKLRGDYSSKQLCRKTRGLRKSFERRRKGPPPAPGGTDPLQYKVYHLSNSIWGKEEEAATILPITQPLDYPRLSQFFADVSVPELLRKHWVLMGKEAAVEFEKGLNNLHPKEIEVALRLEKATLDLEICNKLAEIISRQLQSSSSSSDNNNPKPELKLELKLRELYLFCENKSLRLKECQLEWDKSQLELNHQSSEKRRGAKEARQPLVGTPIALDNDINENNCDQESDRSTKSKDEKKRNLKNVEPLLDGGISSKEETDAVDLSMDCTCVLGKSENKQLIFGGAEKKKEKDEVDDKVDSQSNVKTLASGMVIEEVVVGDPNKGTATEGRMARILYTGKVKVRGRDRFFELTLNRDLLTILTGRDEMREGFGRGIEGMHVGGKRRLIIPLSLGFGDEGNGKEVPPKSWLEYEVQLLGVRSPN